MALFATIASTFGGRMKPAVDKPKSAGWRNWLARPFLKHRERRVDAAKDSRLNAKLWADETDESLNKILISDLKRMRMRCTLESRRNPIVEGVINTHVIDVVGPQGPALQVISENRQFADAFEAAWKDWWGSPDINGVWSGVDFLDNAIRSQWTDGEYIVQETYDPAIRREVSYRLHGISPRLLETPYNKSSAKLTLGVERTDAGRPLRYWFAQDDGHEWPSPPPQLQYTPVDADSIIHDFRKLEPGQARGVPWLSSAIEAIGELREFGIETLDAARAAANQAVYFYTDDPEAPPVDFGEDPPGEVEIQRRMISWCPPRWKPGMLSPTHPNTVYVDYVRERLREIGRPVSMPLMIILLDASRHNYSSARFDDQIYAAGIKALQRRLERTFMARCIRRFRREAELLGLVPRGADDAQFKFIWPVRPHVDPAKEANGLKTYMGLNLITFSDACAQLGKDRDQVIAQLKQDKADLEAAGFNGDFSEAAMTELKNGGDEDDNETPVERPNGE